MKWIVLVSLMLSQQIAKGQDFNENEFSWTYTKSPELSKHEIFTKLKIAMVEMYKSYSKVVEIEDEEIGVIILKPLFQTEAGQGLSLYSVSGVVNYSVKLEAKDSSFTATIYGFYHESTDVRTSASGGSLTNEKPICGYSRLSKKSWGAIKSKARVEALSIVKELIQVK